ncbi:MAG: hypothetical protein M3O70_04160 [Actinomycetota bacterium]|nr:hypothetical protein [Actinomycetota bacterium]
MVEVPYEEHQAAGAELATDLARESPTVAALLREHWKDNEEMLPTVFLGDLARWYVEAWTHRDEERRAYEEAIRVVDRLGSHFENGDPPLQNTIAVGFVEVLPYPGEDGRGSVEGLPEPLRAERARMESWTPGT